MDERCHALVIGGGFFGLYVAWALARRNRRVVLCERGPTLMARASYNNQARVHNGYHYPRSVLTAIRSRVSFPRFREEFADCIEDSFESVYLVGRLLSKITARQFQLFCQRIGAPCSPAPASTTRLLNPRLVEGAFSTEEVVFNALKLRQVMAERVASAGVDLRFETEVRRVQDGLATGNKQPLRVELADGCQVGAEHVFNCTYARLNGVLSESGLELIPLKHEMTETALVEVPEPLRARGVTVMCGPFFSLLPFPPRGLHSLSHVRYTPHYEWRDEPGVPYRDGLRHAGRVVLRTAFRRMVQDARRYVPLLGECTYRDSLWEVKTVLPRSETDDSRPILFRRDHGLPGLHHVMGGKIDNVYDIIEVFKELGLA